MHFLLSCLDCNTFHYFFISLFMQRYSLLSPSLQSLPSSCCFVLLSMALLPTALTVITIIMLFRSSFHGFTTYSPYCDYYHHAVSFFFPWLYYLHPLHALYWKFKTYIPRNETARPYSQVLHSYTWERFIYSHYGSYLESLFSCITWETSRLNRRSKDKGRELPPSRVWRRSHLPSPPLLRLSQEFT